MGCQDVGFSASVLGKGIPFFFLFSDMESTAQPFECLYSVIHI